MRRTAEIAVRVQEVGDGAVVGAVDVDGATQQVRFTSDALDGADHAGAADALLAATLFPAMGAARRLCMTDAVSPQLLGSVPAIQDIVRCWEQRYPAYERYQRVDVVAPARVDAEPGAGRGTAAFFTGGVDSFFTATRHLDELDALVYVRGFDVRPGHDELQERVLAGVQRGADALGKPLVVVGCDLRRFADPLARWEAYHGAALASVAHVLSSRFSTMYIAATLTYAHLAPLGSHPLLDPLWSSERIELVHDGAHASRLDKLRAIADSPAVQGSLRVCWENRDGAYNCGRCEKCLRTMVALRALGRLDDMRTFPSSIDPADVARVTLPEIAYTWEASLALLEAERTDPPLAGAVRRRLYSPGVRVVHRSRYYARRVRRILR